MGGSGSNQNSEKDRSSTSLFPFEEEVPRRRQILIVEDNKADIFLIREAIVTAQIAADLHIVPDGEQATQFFDAADTLDSAPRPDLVLLDLNLPKKNGDEVLRHLRASRACNKAPVLIISSSDSDKDRQIAKDLGAIYYFPKPSEYEEFLKLGPIVKSFLSEPTI